MPKSVVTNIATKKMLEARAGIAPLSKITGVAFGDGGVIENIVQIPDPGSPYLGNELHRQKIDRYEVTSNFCISYFCTLAKETLAGKTINEIALYDSDGDIVAIKTFHPKTKDSDMEMVFEIEDTFYREGER